MATQKSKNASPQKISQKIPNTVTLPRNWRTYFYYGLIIVWAIIAIKVYTATLTIPSWLPSNTEPHPITSGTSHAELPRFGDALRISVISLLPLVMCTLSIIALRLPRWRKAVLALHGVVVIGFIAYVHATLLWQASFRTFTPPSQPQTLKNTIVQRLQCGDTVRTVDSYTYGAKTFYELKDQGYELKTTYESPTGMLDSDAACNIYYNVRDHYAGNRIVLQLFTYDKNNNPAPYLYKDAEKNNVHYGIFVKN